ncbi:hypothetical protein CCAX7_62380 [Capsulimonas corticalis]|uniref:Uncharacterized protein n=2 Tax=Capsulimonas corticalis TaxID=2219043 RepID=A0A402CWK1_9BACT|nr:hypothetical protein CCAX7_62380 [Capsulimonas corticalis]
MACADCGVFPSRAQAWCSEALEMMGMGKPVIVTNCSAHTEHCNRNNSLLIDIDERETANDGIWFHGDGDWARLGSAQEEQMVGHMRHIHVLKQAGEDLFNQAGVETVQPLTWRNTVNRLLHAVDCFGQEYTG